VDINGLSLRAVLNAGCWEEADRAVFFVHEVFLALRPVECTTSGVGHHIKNKEKNGVISWTSNRSTHSICRSAIALRERFPMEL
jgi:hypothetical protein